MDHMPENMYQERAMHCLAQARLSQDQSIKKYWDELALEWIDLQTEKLSNIPSN